MKNRVTVKEFKKMTKKQTKYRARKVKVCPECWSELVETITDGLFTCPFCPALYKGKADSTLDAQTLKTYDIKDYAIFHSKDEQLRGAQLKVMERKGLISGLERQVRFNLFPKMFMYLSRHNGDTLTIKYDSKKNYPGFWHNICFAWEGDIKLYNKCGKERPVILKREEKYILDFRYYTPDYKGWMHGEDLSKGFFEDFKGYQTRDSKKKIALFEKLYGVKVTITTREDLK